MIFKVAKPPLLDQSGAGAIREPEITGDLGKFHHMPLRAVILDEIQRIAIEHKKVIAPLEDAAPLLSIGLDSLCLAVLIVRLEETLGVDPFSGDSEVEFPYTLGDLVRTYEVAAPAA